MIFKDLHKAMTRIVHSGKHDVMYSMCSMSLKNCHAKGLFSLVVENNEGQLLRVFVAQEDVNPFDIQLHSHKYDLTIGVLCGEFTHHDATDWYSVPIRQKLLQPRVTLPAYTYNSSDESFSELGEDYVIITNHIVPKHGIIELSSTDIHTVSAKKGTMWVIQEGEKYSEVSKLLGKPFDATELYDKPTQQECICMFNTIYGVVSEMLK